MSYLENLTKRLREHEGVVNHMYLDTLGYVTAAIGHLLSSPAMAQALPFLNPDGSKASPEEISAEFWHVHALEKAHLPGYYAIRTKLRLTSEFMDELLGKDILANSPASLIPGFDSFPDPAKEALLDMSFQLGAHGLVSKFPHLMQAVKSRDWNFCALLCKRQGIQEWRNTSTSDLFRSAAAR